MKRLLSVSLLMLMVSWAVSGSCGIATIACAAQQISSPDLAQGTVITPQNWWQYKNYMPAGMQALFAGAYHWKFPANFQMVVGPSHRFAPPKSYQENTEKYSAEVKIVQLPGGGHSLSGYVAGLPFPRPADPLKGWKILVDEWYRYVPYLICSAPSGYQLSLNDRFGHAAQLRTPLVYRRLSHISDPGMPLTDPQAQGIDYSEWIEVLQPEESRYSQNLTLYYDDPAKPEDVFLFIPALRRSLRLSSAARCSPFVGTDWTQDDVRTGFNGGIIRWQAEWLKNQRILTLITANPEDFGSWSNYYRGVLFPKPSWAKFELRDSYVIDVRRIRSQRPGYCYGKQVMYIDQENYNLYWKDIYDSSMHYWKALIGDHIASPVPGEGMQAETGNLIESVYDMQNGHSSIAISTDPEGGWVHNNQACRNYQGVNYDNVARYSTAAGLAQVLR
ncbi:MAG: DUF1329 domain-containing protein [Candidatus Binataceae bacterium]|nr:DUF1329 domain-containing protein [Candidatus Binataceae bacterium]